MQIRKLCSFLTYPNLVFLPSLYSISSGDDTSLKEQSEPETSTGQHTLQKDFSAFVERFPVLLGCPPPTKKQRVDSGFTQDRMLYDKWRASQYAQRVKYLLCRSPNHSIRHRLQFI